MRNWSVIKHVQYYIFGCLLFGVKLLEFWGMRVISVEIQYGNVCEISKYRLLMWFVVACAAF